MNCIFKKYNTFLLLIFLVIITVSCQKGGEPVPYAEDSAFTLNNEHHSGARIYIVGGDDNEDDDDGENGGDGPGDGSNIGGGGN